MLALRPALWGRACILGLAFRTQAQLLALTFVNLLTPSGWQALIADLSEGVGTLTCEGESIGLAGLLGPRLLTGLPVTLVRYPLAAVLKAPVLLLPLAGLLAFSFGGYDAAVAEPVSDAEVLQAFALSVLETLVLGRVLLVGLLEVGSSAPARARCQLGPCAVARSPARGPLAVCRCAPRAFTASRRRAGAQLRAGAQHPQGAL